MIKNVKTLQESLLSSNSNGYFRLLSSVLSKVKKKRKKCATKNQKYCPNCWSIALCLMLYFLVFWLFDYFCFSTGNFCNHVLILFLNDKLNLITATTKISQQPDKKLNLNNCVWTQVDPKMSSLGFLEAKITPKWRTTDNDRVCCEFFGLGGGTVVVGGSACCDYEGVGLVVDFWEVIMTTPPELAHSAALPPTSLGRPDTSS